MLCDQAQVGFFRIQKSFSLLLYAVTLSLFSFAWAQPDPTPAGTPKYATDPGKVQRARDFLERGDDYAQKGFLEKAREMWKLAVQLDPDSSEIRERLNPAPNSVDSKPMEGTNNKSPQGRDVAEIGRANELFSRAQEAYDRKKYHEAQKYLEMAGTLLPNDSRVKSLESAIILEDFEPDPERPYNDLVKSYFEEAVGHYRDKDYEEATQSVDQAQKLDPKQPQVQKLKELIDSQYSDVLYGREVERAKSEWRTGDDAIAREIIGNVLSKNPNFQKAVELQGQMDQADKTSDDERDGAQVKKANEEQGSNYLKDEIKKLKDAVADGKTEEAADYLKQIENMAPDFPKLGYWKEKIKELSGNGASRTSEAKADAAYNMGLESYRKGDLAGAKEFWKETLDWNPRHDHAKRDLERLIEEHPELK